MSGEIRSFNSGSCPSDCHSPAPLLFTKVVKELAALPRQKGICLHCYLDNWLILADSRSKRAGHTSSLLSLLRLLSFLPNIEKSELNPTQPFVYRGMSFDTVPMTVHPVSPVSTTPYWPVPQRQPRNWPPFWAAWTPCLHSFHQATFSSIPSREFRRCWSPSSRFWDHRLPLGTWF